MKPAILHVKLTMAHKEHDYFCIHLRGTIQPTTEFIISSSFFVARYPLCVSRARVYGSAFFLCDNLSTFFIVSLMINAQ